MNKWIPTLGWFIVRRILNGNRDDMQFAIRLPSDEGLYLVLAQITDFFTERRHVQQIEIPAVQNYFLGNARNRDTLIVRRYATDQDILSLFRLWNGKRGRLEAWVKEVKTQEDVVDDERERFCRLYGLFCQG